MALAFVAVPGQLRDGVATQPPIFESSAIGRDARGSRCWTGAVREGDGLDEAGGLVRRLLKTAEIPDETVRWY